MDFDEFEKEVKGQLDSGTSFEKIPSVIKRCPKCSSLTLEYDPSGRIKCTKCGFKYDLPKMGYEE